jgi:hypothetical protein
MLVVAVVATACSDHARFIVVEIDAPGGAPDVVQVRIDAVVGNDVGTLVAPRQPADVPLKWPESFSLEVPTGDTGTAQLYVTAADANGCEAMAASTEFPGSASTVSIMLAPFAPGPCLSAGTPVVRSVSAATSTGAPSMSIAIPAGTAQNDLLVAFFGMEGGEHNSLAAPADWSVLPNMDYMVGTTGTRTHAFWKVAGAGEPASYLFTEMGSSQQDLDGMIVAVVGADTANPIEAANGQLNPKSSSCPSPSMSTTTDHTLLLYACAVEIGSSAVSSLPFAPPTDMSQLAAIQSTGTYQTGEETAWGGQATAGMTGQFAAMASCSSINIGLMVAITSRGGTR